MKAWLRKHSLSLFLAALLIGFISITLLMGPKQYREERDLPPDAPISTEYWEWWGYNTVLSLEADIWGALLLVVLTKKLIEKGSAESKRSPEEE